jgi:hypothetical protein
MKKVTILLLVVLLVAGAAWGKNFEVTKKVDDFTVKVEVDKNPPIVGDNNLTLTIKDSTGKNIIDANVKLEYSMPAMQGMPAVNYKAEAALKGNEYRAKVNFSMAGGWNMIIQITQAGKVKKVKLNVDVK